MAMYGVDNFTVSYIRGIPIYKPIDPTKPLSYLIAAALPFLTCLIFLAWEQFVIWKIRKFNGDARVYNKLKGEDIQTGENSIGSSLLV